MNDVLMEILRTNKLIKALIKEKDIDAIQLALSRKNELIKAYDQDPSEEDMMILKKIKEIDAENMKKMKDLMGQVKDSLTEVRLKKGSVKNSSNKVRKYKNINSASGYRFDRKK